MPGDSDQPFQELPEALVSDLLDQSQVVGELMLESFNQVRQRIAESRSQLTNAGLRFRDTQLGYPPIPTTCGVDGSYAIDRLLSTDLAAEASVAVEGLTPPSETRHWEHPRHRSLVRPIPHHADNAVLLRALMIGQELELSAQAPHEVVFLDGSLTTPLIYLNQALNVIAGHPDREFAHVFEQGIQSFLSAYREILLASRTDRLACGVPKYTSRRELGDRFGWPISCDDRALLTQVLEPGEFAGPVPADSPSSPWHLNLSPLPSAVREAVQPISVQTVAALGGIYILYYRPHEWTPALRIEVPSAVAANRNRLAALLQAVKHQCATPSILEPYPLYMADRMAKHLGRALPAFRQVATQRMAERYDGDIGHVFFSMHGYRTDTGR
jgi:hypothetical protein